MSKTKTMISALLALAMLTGCNRSAPEESSSAAERELVKLTVWGRAEEQDMLVQLCEDFARAHPEKKYAFTLGVMSDEDAAEELLEADGDRADVFCFQAEDMRELAEAGALFRLTTDRGWIAENFSADGLTAAEYSGELYGYPVSADACILYYDRTLFPEGESATLEQLLHSAPDGRISLAMDMTDERQLAGFFMGAGCSVFGQPCRFNGENGLLAAEYLLRLADEPNLAAEYDSDDVKSGFASGRIAAAIADTEIAPEIKSTLGADFGVCALPRFTLPDGTPAQMGGIAEYRLSGVSSRSSSPADAMEFARLLAEHELQKYRLEHFDELPAELELSSDEDVLRRFPELRALREQLKYSQHPRSDGFMEHAEDFGESLLEGKVTLNNLRERLNRFAELALAAG